LNSAACGAALVKLKVSTFARAAAPDEVPPVEVVRGVDLGPGLLVVGDAFVEVPVVASAQVEQ
jgi:hypothetical protein